MKKAIKVIILTVLSLIFVLLFTIIVKSWIYPKEVPGIFGYKPMIVMSGSMEPTIKTGDLIIVKETDVKSLKKDDIIAFRVKDDTLVSHRIVDVSKDKGQYYFETKGDNNNTKDEGLVKDKNVEGKYKLRIAKLGSFLMFIATPLGFVVLLLAAIILFLIIFLVIRSKGDKKEEELMKEFEEKKDEFEKFMKNKNKHIKSKK